MSDKDHRNAWHRWYDTPRWQRIRSFQLMEHPLCAICLESRGMVVPASVVDHVVPHKGDWTAFCTGKLQSLCKPCHDGDKRMVELRGYSTAIGDDGWPLDQRHPAYQGNKPTRRG
jgi:5-methylcytosine-specific restriction enzyme A